MLLYYNSQYIDTTFEQIRLIDDVNSGINIVLDNPDLLKDSTTLELYENEDRKVKIRRQYWGMFEIIYATAKWNNYSFAKTALIGDDLFSGEQVALYVTEQKCPLSVCGKTIIHGNCFLPENSPKKVTIEGQNFNGDNLVEGKVKNSQKKLPDINQQILDFNKHNLFDSISTTDSIVYWEQLANTDSITNSFNNKTIIVYVPELTNLGVKYFTGNIIIKSKGIIEISENTKIQDAIIYAPAVVFETGFKGCLQVVASDSVIVNEDCILKYPSSIIVINKGQNTENNKIELMNDSKVYGAIVLYSEKDLNGNSLIRINEEAEIYGQLWSNCFIELKGKVFGSVFTSKFILKTRSSLYENLLLNATIDMEALSKNYTGINLQESFCKKEVVRWLN